MADLIPINRPNRLKGMIDPKTGAILQWASKETKVEPVPAQPTLVAKILNGIKIASLVLAALAATVVSLAAGGVAVPPGLLAVATSIGAVAAALGIASPGLKPAQKQEAPPADNADKAP